MSRYALAWGPLALALVLTACTPAKIVVSANGSVQSNPAGATPAAAPVGLTPAGAANTTTTVTTAPVNSVISGRVSVPAAFLNANGIIAGGGGNIIAGGGGNIIAGGGGNIIAGGGGNIIAGGGGNYRTVLAESEASLTNATVALADLNGQPIPGFATVKTDASGHFSFKDVPADFTFVVAVQATTTDGRTAYFQTLTRSQAAGATADVSTASTMVTVGVVNGLIGLGEFDATAFGRAVAAAATELTPNRLPDFTARANIVFAMQALGDAAPAVKALLVPVQERLKQNATSLATLTALVAKRPAPTSEPRPPESTGCETPGAKTHHFVAKWVGGRAYNFKGSRIDFKVAGGAAQDAGKVLASVTLTNADGTFTLCVPEDQGFTVQLFDETGVSTNAGIRYVVVASDKTDTPELPLVLELVADAAR